MTQDTSIFCTVAAALLLTLAAWLAPCTAQGQSDESQPASAPAAETQDADSEFSYPQDEAEGPRAGPRGPRHGPFGPGPRHRGRLAPDLFRAGPEDQGPLRPGEDAELLAFARQRMPRVYRGLEALQQRNPERLRQKLSEFAPRLRHLRRLYERSPRLGAILLAHAENIAELERIRRSLPSGATGSAEYADALQELRDLILANVRLEADALDALATDLDERHAQRVDERLGQLTSAEADVAQWPERLRALISAYRAAPTDAERQTAFEELRTAAERQVTLETSALRERAARLRERAPQLVDERLARTLEDRPPRPSGR